MALRYIRENLHHADPATGSVFEYINDWWPIQWSHHYVASGDSAVTFQSACAAGDVDGHWPAFDTIAESAYANGGTLWHATGSNAMEMEPLFLQAVIDGLFGVKPWFGDNLLVLRPSPPSSWNDLEIKHVDAAYKFHRDAAGASMEVTTPVPRRVRVEIPVRCAVKEVTLDGAPVKYQLETAVNCARVVAEAPAAREHRFAVKYANVGQVSNLPKQSNGQVGNLPHVEGSTHAILDERATFSVRHAKVVAVHDPQHALRDVTIAPQGDGANVSFVAARAGKPTAFLELQSGKVAWLKPLDLTVSPPWSIRTRYLTEFIHGGPAVVSPAVNENTRELTLELSNARPQPIAGTAKITVNGTTFTRDVTLAPSADTRLVVPLAPFSTSFRPAACRCKSSWPAARKPRRR